MNHGTTVAICIATYRRAAELCSLLRALDALAFPDIAEPRVRIVVADNDPHASAAPLVRETISRFPIDYVHEPCRGISFARNTAIRHAQGSDFIAFLDDDEHPSPTWLNRLLAAHLAYDAPIVAGRVVPLLPQPVDSLIAAHLTASRTRFPTGTPLRSAGAGNVLIAASVLRAMGPQWFDPRFALTGGEDTHFFRRCLAAGFPIICADDAVVYESVSPSRLTPAYLCARARSGANHWTRVELELSSGATNSAFRFGIGVLRILQGWALRLVSPACKPAIRFRAQLLLAEGRGNLDAFLGRTYPMYGAVER